MSKHHMIDLETLDTKPSAIVVSIGIAEFDSETFEITNTSYSVLEMGAQLYRGRSRGADTVAWWEQQSDEAKAVFRQPREEVTTALDSVAKLLVGTQGVWGNGSDFDCVILRSLYESFHNPAPWRFSKNRCLRTLKNVVPISQYSPIERAGTYHNALDDALHQVKELQSICVAGKLRF